MDYPNLSRWINEEYLRSSGREPRREVEEITWVKFRQRVVPKVEYITASVFFDDPTWSFDTTDTTEPLVIDKLRDLVRSKPALAAPR